MWHNTLVPNKISSEKQNMGDQSLMSLVLLLSLLLCISLNYLLRRKTATKRLPPGPWPLPIIGHLHLMKDPFQRTLHNLSSKYGHVMLLKFGARKVVVVSSPEAVEECFSKNDVVFANRPQHLLSKIFCYGSTPTFSMAPYGDHFRNIRRLVNLELLSSNRVSALGYIRQQEVHSLLKQLLGRRSSDSKPTKVELKSLMIDLSFNILTRMIAGKRYYGSDETSVEAKTFREIIGEVMELSAISKLEDHLPFLELMDIHGMKKRAVTVMKKMDELFQKLVDDRRKLLQYNGAKEAKLTTLIDIMFSLQDSNPEYSSDENIKSVMLSLLLAGTETPATTLEWAMTFLLNNPETMQKIVHEIETCVGKYRILDENDLPKLVYLQNVIEETLRLSSPVPLIVPHESSDDCRICGFDIPKGTMLLVNAWAIQRDPKLWEEPTKFKPERFINISENKGHNNLIPFGMGRRGCPGANLGRKFLALALGSMIQCFSWERENEEMIDIAEVTGLTMQKRVPLEAMCKPRQIIIDSFASNPLFGSDVL